MVPAPTVPAWPWTPPGMSRLFLAGIAGQLHCKFWILGEVCAGGAGQGGEHRKVGGCSIPGRAQGWAGLGTTWTGGR